MDLQSALICVLVFVVSGAILLLISMFGIKEKSYEEALAEQRKLTSGLLGTNQKKSNKEKKQKQKEKKENKKLNKEKNEKKTKEVESIEEVDSELNEEAEPDKLVHSSHSKMHVEFDEPTVLETPPVTTKVRHMIQSCIYCFRGEKIFLW